MRRPSFAHRLVNGKLRRRTRGSRSNKPGADALPRRDSWGSHRGSRRRGHEEFPDRVSASQVEAPILRPLAYPSEESTAEASVPTRGLPKLHTKARKPPIDHV